MIERYGQAAGRQASPSEFTHPFRFRLYIAGGTPNSVEAAGNLTDLCHERLGDSYEIELIDVFREPIRALDDGILMTPTLVRLTPDPVVRIVGTLSDRAKVALALGLQAATP